MARQSGLRVTSAAKAEARPPSPLMIPAVSSARSTWASTQRTDAPSRAKRMAAALPLPRPGPRDPAPATIATLPVRRPLTAQFLKALSMCTSTRYGPPEASPRFTAAPISTPFSTSSPGTPSALAMPT